MKFAIGALQECVTNLEHAHDDLEQYSCHLCVLVEDIFVGTDETADNVLEKVKNILKEACSKLSGDVIDQEHQIGSNCKCFKTSNTCRSVVLHFKGMKHRTSFYQKRNKLKGVRIKLDLTK